MSVSTLNRREALAALLSLAACKSVSRTESEPANQLTNPTKSMSFNPLPTYFISHGAGPWPWLEESDMPINFEGLADALRAIPGEIATRPKAILLVSAHWEEPEFTVQTTAKPLMIYDYFGFPAHTYRIKYPAPGAPEVAARVIELLEKSGIVVRSDNSRGFDHGAYAPLYVAYPKADVPVFPMSLRKGLNPAEHLAVGRALAPLREEEVLIICSGLPSYHNMQVRDVTHESEAFDAWLTETMIDCSADERVKRLLAWEEAPFSRLAHPREEHFIPGLVAVGAAENDVGHRSYHEEKVMGWMSTSGYRFGITGTAGTI